MNEHTISRIAIYMLSIVMIIFGINHFLQPKSLLTYVPPFLPGGIIWVYVVGVAFILAALSFVFNTQVKLAAWLLAIMLLIFVLAVHLPNFMEAGNEEMKQQALVSILKDSALAAFALHIASNARTVG
ncbi:MAG TPA: hypothetical protein VNA26_08385 [Chitinophagaceae bacterium]|nr:hypothetical protein [Chitinophagaceae bacterium]